MNNSVINVNEKALSFVKLLEIANQLREYSKERINLEFDLFGENDMVYSKEKAITDEFHSEISQILLSHENQDFDVRVEYYRKEIAYRNIIINIA